MHEGDPLDWKKVDVEALITIKDIAALTGYAAGTLYNKRKEWLPPPAVDRPRHVRWRAGDILAWWEIEKKSKARRK